MPTIRMMACVLSLLMLAACSGSDQDQQAREDLQHAEQAWADSNIHDYQYTLTMYCFCYVDPSHPGMGEYTIKITDGVIESAFNTASGVYLNADQAASLPTVDDLFDQIADAYDKDADDVDVSYDDSFGFPVDLLIDPIKGAVDDEIEYHVRDFM